MQVAEPRSTGYADHVVALEARRTQGATFSDLEDFIDALDELPPTKDALWLYALAGIPDGDEEKAALHLALAGPVEHRGPSIRAVQLARRRLTR